VVITAMAFSFAERNFRFRADRLRQPAVKGTLTNFATKKVSDQLRTALRVAVRFAICDSRKRRKSRR